jgi:RNA polymerase sigma factor (sigma-70 family)
MQRSVRLASRLGWDAQLSEDVAQEAVLRLWVAIDDGKRVESPEAWIKGAIRRIYSNRMRGARGELRRLLARSSDTFLERVAASLWADPERQATLCELSARLPALLWRLPPPCRQIALLQHAQGSSRAEVIAFLRGWRPVGTDEARRLIKLTHAMLRALGRDEDPSALWPQTSGRKKSPWLTTPPPQIRPLGR